MDRFLQQVPLSSRNPTERPHACWKTPNLGGPHRWMTRGPITQICAAQKKSTGPLKGRSCRD